MSTLRSLLALVLAAAAPAASVAAAEPLRIFAVNAPLAWYAQSIAGDAAAVLMPVPEGRDPASWRPSLSLLAEAQEADLVLLNGGGYAAWVSKMSLPRRSRVDASRGLEDRRIVVPGRVHSHGEEGEHSHGVTAPELWLDFDLARAQAAAVGDALRRARPEDAAAFDAGEADLAARLEALDAEAKALAPALAGCRFAAPQSPYAYFARAYGLSIADVDAPPEAVPDAAALDALIAALGPGEGAAALLWLRAPAPGTAEALASGDVALIVFDSAASAPPTEVPQRWADGLAALADFAAEAGCGDG